MNTIDIYMNINRSIPGEALIGQQLAQVRRRLWVEVLIHLAPAAHTVCTSSNIKIERFIHISSHRHIPHKEKLIDSSICLEKGASILTHNHKHLPSDPSEVLV